MPFFRRYRVPVVLVGLAVLVVVLVGYRIKKQQAAAVPRRQVEIVVGVAKPVQKDLDVKLAYTADVSAIRQVAIFEAALTGSPYLAGAEVSLADFMLFPIIAYVRVTPEGDAAMAKAPRLAAWFGRMAARPSAAATDPARE